jgi:D-alanyl-D-alanine carboxypeptidase/D-alanyl-D-alanine-endopeptidase (penicillin-binding protein 4)
VTAGTKETSSATVSADVAVDAAATATTSGATSTAGRGRRWPSVDGLDPAAVEIMNKPAYAAGQWAIAVRDLDSGEKIIGLDTGVLVEPGSVTKTYAAAAAWLQFGPDSTVVTPVKRTGDVVDGHSGR